MNLTQQESLASVYSEISITWSSSLEVEGQRAPPPTHPSYAFFQPGKECVNVNWERFSWQTSEIPPFFLDRKQRIQLSFIITHIIKTKTNIIIHFSYIFIVQKTTSGVHDLFFFLPCSNLMKQLRITVSIFQLRKWRLIKLIECPQRYICKYKESQNFIHVTEIRIVMQIYQM